VFPVRYGLGIYIIISLNFRLQRAIFITLLKAIAVSVIPIKVCVFMDGINVISLRAF
jgi:hypothetical protein